MYKRTLTKVLVHAAKSYFKILAYFWAKLDLHVFFREIPSLPPWKAVASTPFRKCEFWRGLGWGYKRWGLALREFFPIALRGRAGAAPRGSRPWGSNLLILLNFFRLVDRHSIQSQSTRGTLGWAGKFGKLCRIVKENNFEFREINVTVKSTFARNVAIYFS